MRHVLILLLLLSLPGCGAAKYTSNEDYLDYLASIVIRYHKLHAAPPQGFDQALSDSGLTLDHRGDLYGGHLEYFNFGTRAFMFRAHGANQKSDQGLLDDVDVYFIDMKKVSREDFIAFAKTSEDGIYWNSSSFLFSEQK